ARLPLAPAVELLRLAGGLRQRRLRLRIVLFEPARCLVVRLQAHPALALGQLLRAFAPQRPLPAHPRQRTTARTRPASPRPPRRPPPPAPRSARARAPRRAPLRAAPRSPRGSARA